MESKNLNSENSNEAALVAAHLLSKHNPIPLAQLPEELRKSIVVGDGPSYPAILHKFLATPLYRQKTLSSNFLDSYRVRKADAKKSLSSGDYVSYIICHTDPFRLKALIEVQQHLSDSQFWRIFGVTYNDLWSPELMRLTASDIFALLKLKRNCDEHFMTAKEHKAFAKLPDQVEIYRGCIINHNEKSHFWSLKSKRAQWFANEYHEGGDVFKKIVSKSDILAIKIRGKDFDAVLRNEV